MSDSIRHLGIVGASARAAAFSALRAGYEVVTADLFADADLRRACRAGRVKSYPEGLEDWLENRNCDAWMYTGALENHVRLVDRMATSRPLLGNQGTALAAVRDPLRLQDVLRVAGISFPDTVASPAGLPLDGSWLCKTYRHSSGMGVWRLNGAEQRERAVREEACFQRYVEGTPAAAVYAVFADRARLLGVTRQLLGSEGDHAWRYRGSVSLTSLNVTLTAQLLRLGEILAQDFELRGLAGVDLVLGEDRVWVIEINPRYTASVEVVERANGIDAIPLHIAACTESMSIPSSLPQPGIPTPAHGKAVLYAERDVTITQKFYEWAMVRAGAVRLKPELADIPVAGEDIQAGHPVLTVFAAGDDCEQLLNDRLAEVAGRLYAAG